MSRARLCPPRVLEDLGVFGIDRCGGASRFERSSESFIKLRKWNVLGRFHQPGPWHSAPMTGIRSVSRKARVASFFGREIARISPNFP